MMLRYNMIGHSSCCKGQSYNFRGYIVKKYAALLLVVLIALVGCAPPAALVVTLDSPGNGSTVESLTPILAWTCSETGATFRVQVASDGNFQNLIIDESGLGAPSYTLPSGRLNSDQAYYWRVNASKAGRTSDWATYWSFRTPGPTPPPTAGTIVVNSTLEGSPWSGRVNYVITGPEAQSGSSAPQTFSNLAEGTYSLTYSSGGPGGATLVSITPSPTQTLSTDGTITFTLNFDMQPTSSIVVSATLDGSPWSGRVNYNIRGPYADSHSSVPYTFTDLPDGTYTLHYTSRGPDGATLASITPSPTQNLPDGGTVYFTMNFHTEASGSIFVQATLDGSDWSGQVKYTIQGPYTDTNYSVPDSFDNLPEGSYTLVYRSGGPSGAQFGGISPKSTQYLSPGGHGSFTLNFYSQATGTITVRATLDGREWRTAVGSGPIDYAIHGPHTDSSSNMPDTFTDLPAGTYTLVYRSGGPIGATYVGVTPHTVRLDGGSGSFTMNFVSEAKGTVYVSATYNGRPWSGQVRYTLSGPYVDSSNYAPDSFTNCPSGSYTLSYTSGGPDGAILRSIGPRPTQNLSSGGSISFTMEFVAGLLPPEQPESTPLPPEPTPPVVE